MIIAKTILLVKRGDEFHHLASGEKIAVGGYNQITRDGRIFFTVEKDQQQSVYYFYLCRFDGEKNVIMQRKQLLADGLYRFDLRRGILKPDFFPTPPKLRLVA